jgi:hypothetical protein
MHDSTFLRFLTYVSIATMLTLKLFRMTIPTLAIVPSNTVSIPPDLPSPAEKLRWDVTRDFGRLARFSYILIIGVHLLRWY